MSNAYIEKKLRCPNCGSSRAYLRMKTQEIVCPSCGAITKRVQKKES